jgi:hypothetical protein
VRTVGGVSGPGGVRDEDSRSRSQQIFELLVNFVNQSGFTDFIEFNRFSMNLTDFTGF